MIEEVLKEIESFVDIDFEISAPRKSVNFSIYDANPLDVEALVRKRGYRLACVCGPIEETVRIIATTEVKKGGFEIVNTVYSRPIPMADYLKLRMESGAK